MYLIVHSTMIFAEHGDGLSLVTGPLSEQTRVSLHLQPCARAVAPIPSWFSKLLGSVP